MPSALTAIKFAVNALPYKDSNQMKHPVLFQQASIAEAEAAQH